MRTLLPTRRAACTTALVFSVFGAAAGTLTARSAPASSRCEMDRCGNLGAICITTEDKTGCDALTDGSCQTYACNIT